jgi:hypothetical protein
MTAAQQAPGAAAELAQLRQDSMRLRFDKFSPRLLTWLGALPTWTVSLGVSLGLGQTAAMIGDIVASLRTADLIESRQVLQWNGEPADAFWLRPSIRPDLGSYLQKFPQSQLGRDLGDLAAAVAKQQAEAVSVGSIGSEDWAKIITDYLDDPSGGLLLGAVNALLGTDRFVAAKTLVTAARGIGELASSSLLDGARRARWRVDGAMRVAQDLERLTDYCHRPEIEQAIEDLLAGPGKTWALHLLGDSGVGKTMLIRYLASGRFSADHQRAGRFLVTRVDFDRLDASYPEQRPAELLLALGTELEPFVTTRDIDNRYRRFQDRANLLQERRSGGEDDESDLVETAKQFARFLRSLPARVLLVLDTCEELAKLYTPLTDAPAINATFHVIELINAELDTVRVLMAGRRWLVPPPDQKRRASGPLLHPRSYLRVMRVPGFSKTEAEQYLEAREGKRRAADQQARPLPPGLLDAVLARSRSRGRRNHPRYSPFELAAYCDWIAEDPLLDADRLRTAPGDPYVEWRIIDKLGDDQARTALGTAAALGRFDFKLIAPALDRAELDPGHVFDVLAAQEWVNVLSLRADGRPKVIEVDEHLRNRIRRVTAVDSARFPVDRLQLGQDAREVIDRTELADIPAETVVAAVVLLPAQVAAGVWRQIEDKVTAGGQWGWADEVASRVRAAEQARLDQEPDSPTIMAALIVSQACARLHRRSGSGPDVPRLWLNAEREAARYPDGADRAALVLRIRLGRIAAGDFAGKSLLSAALLSAQKDLLPLTGAIIAAIRGCIGRAEDLPDPMPALIEAWAQNTDDLAVKAAAQLAASALRLWAGEHDAAARLAEEAIESANRGVSRAARPWADWVVPHRLLDQCRLIRMHIAWRRGEPIDAVPWEDWRAAALDHTADIDAERLVSATVRFELGHRLVTAQALAVIGGAEQYVPGRRAVAWVHGQVPPLVIQLARAWQVRGDPDRCARVLRDRLELAVATGDDPDIIERCDLALLWLCRRERSTQWSALISRLSVSGTPAQRQEAWLVRTLVDGERPKDPEEAGSWSTWWQCQDRGLELDELWLPVEATAADRRELAERWPREFATRIWADPPARPVAATGRHDFDPAEEIRLGNGLSLPPGDAGRATAAAAEVAALRLPRRRWTTLLDAGLELLGADDQGGGYEAVLLARLAAVRAHDVAAGDNAMWPVDLTSKQAAAVFADRPGWEERLEVLKAYLAGRNQALQRVASPEYRLPIRRTSLERLRSVLGNLPDGVTLILSGAALAITVSATTAFTAFNVIDVALAIAAASGIRVSLQLVPYEFTAARAVEVHSSGGLLTARAVRSRGMRDLTGLRFLTLAGALFGRWSMLALFFPWRGTWQQSVPAGPGPVFDVSGLRLPRQEGVRYLTTIELIVSDAACDPLPWEQWLGPAGTAEQESQIWYRRVAGPPRSLSYGTWRRAGALYRGPRHLAPVIDELDDRSALRLLHLVTTPVPTHGGWRLRVTDTGRALGVVTRGKRADEELLSIDQFPLKNTAVVVLQADPVDRYAEPLGDLRAGFITCAQDLVAGGAGAVLVIPPLPDRLAADAVKIAWRAIAGKFTRPSPMSLLRIAAHLKKLIAEAERPPDNTESAVLDVQLFLRTADQNSHSIAD